MRDSKSLGCYSNWSKKGLLKQVKSPIGSKRTFQIHEYPHELAKASGQANMWYKDNSFMLLYGEKEGG